MTTEETHSTPLFIDEERTKIRNASLSVVVVGFFLITIAFVSLSVQWRRLKAARQHRREQQQQEREVQLHLNQTPHESFFNETFGGTIRRRHNKEYKEEIVTQLNDMKQMQRDVKSQLAGLQTLAKSLSEKKKYSSTSNNYQTNPPSVLKKQK